MTGRGHHIAAAGGAAGLYLAVHSAAPWVHAAAAAIGCLAGGKAPDWLEIPLWRGEARLIPHRRVTHWVAGWAFLLAFAAWLLPNPIRWAAIGFSIGALIHLSGDLLTPMGVPTLHPWRRTAGASFGAPAARELGWVIAVWFVALLPSTVLVP